MTPYELIVKKRDGGSLEGEEIRDLIRDYVAGLIPDYQMTAFLMAVYFRGMNDQETYALLDSFLHSGETISLNQIPGIKVDKHSTGGVGDKTSILIAPIVAAAGVPVPMISGSGLGHTGGTLDKLRSIPGFRVDFDLPTFQTLVSTIGVCLNGQTPELVPADRKIYALRDVTGTIESLPLIASSILSKKLAEGINALVLDVKYGDGAFMRSVEQAEELTRLLIRVGEQSGLTTVAYITNMDNPLGRCIGNWLEIRECIECLQGSDVPDLLELTYQLSGTMIHLGGKASSINEGIEIAQSMITDGKAWEKFCEIVQAQGGDLAVVENPDSYPAAQNITTVRSKHTGWIQSISAREVGLSVIELGGGRKRIEDQIEPKAGIIFNKSVGAHVQKNDTLFTLYTDKDELSEIVADRILSVLKISNKKCEPPVLIQNYLDKNTV
jgi:pyrimidine-nucleoside phosphorylase